MQGRFERLLLDENPDAIVVTTPDGTVVYWNHGAERVFGFGADEAVGRALRALVMPPQQADDLRTETSADDPHASTYQGIRRRKDGSLIYVNVSTRAIRDAQGRVEFLLASKKDITPLKVLNDAKLVAARFGDLLDSTPDGIVMANASGRIVLANAQAETLFGYARGELRGMPVETLLPQQLRAAHVGHRSAYFSQPRLRPMGAGLELHGVRKDGTEFPVEISLSPLQTDEGPLVMSAIRDISERKRIERALHEKNLELQRVAEAKDRFLATMSHELRTPLNAIIGFTGTLLMKLPGPLTDPQQRQLTTVQNSARHLLSLINDLLDLAKIESGRVELRLEQTDCADVVREVEEILRPLAERKGLQLAIEIEDQSVVVATDRRSLSQIAINLVTNAIKFTDAGGSVTVRLAREGGGTTIAVRDTGCGILPQEQAMLFQAFSQLDSSSTRRHDGTGLGLHLSQKLAELLGGTISLQSEIGKGSTFTLRLPGRG